MSRLTLSGLAVLTLLTIITFVERRDAAHAAKNPVVVAGTSWRLVGKSKGSIGGIGKFKENGTIANLFFGPLLSPDIPAGNFLFESETDRGRRISVSGTYTQDQKGKLALDSNSTEVEDLVGAVTIDVGLANGLRVRINNIELSKAKQKAKTKEKKGVPEIKLQLQSKSFVNGSAFGVTSVDLVDSLAKFSFNGKGGQFP